MLFKDLETFIILLANAVRREKPTTPPATTITITYEIETKICDVNHAKVQR